MGLTFLTIMTNFLLVKNLEGHRREVQNQVNKINLWSEAKGVKGAKKVFVIVEMLTQVFHVFEAKGTVNTLIN